MSDIFNEVDEEVRKDRSLELWKAYGKYVIGASVVLVGLTAAYVGWQNYQLNVAQEQGRQYQLASQLFADGKYQEASDSFGLLAKEGAGSYTAMASLREASALIAIGKGDDALKIYDTLAATDADAEFVAAAKIMAGYYLIDHGTADQVRERINGLEVAGNLWSSSAQELLALAALKEGKTDEAAALLNALTTDATAPAGIKSRAEQLLKTLDNNS